MTPLSHITSHAGMQIVEGSGGGGEGRHVRPRPRLHRGMGTIQGKKDHTRTDYFICVHFLYYYGILVLQAG